ncbi:NAD+ synthase [Aliikangiella maris]|uniref:Glutamine-dependent NAD(+) synthetase n=2 Tax=Aliikangiella maris TaxID=3162458 RepID=A0ABV2BRQ3_9GAMM
MKIIIAQLNFTVGDIEGNLDKILTTYQKIRQENALLICTELALTGYYPQDLLLREDLISRQLNALEVLKKETKNQPCAVVVGFAAKNKDTFGKPLFNALAVISDGQQIFEYHKQLLPTYNVFDEARHFAQGTRDNCFTYKGKCIGFLICEDAWYEENKTFYQIDPVANLTNKQLDLIISINASPSNLGKIQERHHLAQKIVQRTNAPFVYANQVGGNDELVFDGGSFIMDKNFSITAQADYFSEDLLSDNNTDKNRHSNNPKMSQESFIWQQVVLGIRDYISKCGFSQVVIGSSGGIDSAVTLAICTAAIGANNVTAITMPSKFSSVGSVNDSVTLCDNLKVSLLHSSITEEFEHAVSQFKEVTGETASPITQENIQARIRGRLLMEYSNHYGALVISTGNKSEMSVGYATLYGDMNGGINPLGDLYKMEVYALAKWINRQAGFSLIPDAIINKEPSAELAAGQQDRDSLPDYPLLDAILKLYIEGDLLTIDEKQVCQNTLNHYAVNQHLLARIHAMVDHAEFKRRQAPPIIRVQKRSFGMGRWLPVAAHYD